MSISGNSGQSLCFHKKRSPLSGRKRAQRSLVMQLVSSRGPASLLRPLPACKPQLAIQPGFSYSPAAGSGATEAGREELGRFWLWALARCSRFAGRLDAMKIRHPLLVRAVGVGVAWAIRRLVEHAVPLSVCGAAGRSRGRTPDRTALHLCLLPRGHAVSGVLLAVARDAYPDQRSPGRRADHAGHLAAGLQRDPRLDHAGRHARAPRDDPARRSRAPVRDPGWAARPAAIGPPGGRLSLQPHGIPHRGRRDGVQHPWRARSWTSSASRVRSARRVCPPCAPSSVPPDADRDTIEDCRREVERRMQAAMLEAEAWVEEL